MKIAIISITKGGKQVAKELQAKLPTATILTEKGVRQKFANNWQSFGGFVCVMATGIVVRSIAPLLADKRTDPCVVVVDEKGRHAISLLSGHLGGGNDLAGQVAEILGGTPVITTASDTLGLVALDLWAKKQNLTAAKEVFTGASSILVNNGVLNIFTDLEVDSLPAGLEQVTAPEKADLIISNRSCYSGKLVLCPRNLVVGTGCNRHTPMAEFDEAATELFTDLGIRKQSIRNLASIDKKNDEVGLLEFAKDKNLSIEFFSKDEINRIIGVEVSKAAMKAVGAIGVAEPCALLSADININSSKLISRKRKWQNITMAVALVPFTLSAQV
jgi:cobalt-precorrin 5A hydrolase